MNRRSWRVVPLLGALLALAVSDSAARDGARDVRGIERVRIEAMAGYAETTLRDPLGRTATVTDSTRSSQIPGCRVAANPDWQLECRGYLKQPGGYFELTDPRPGTWTLTVRMRRDWLVGPRANTGSVQVLAFRDSVIVLDRRDAVRLTHARDWARWKIVVSSPGSTADTASVQLLRDGVKARNGGRGWPAVALPS